MEETVHRTRLPEAQATQEPEVEPEDPPSRSGMIWLAIGAVVLVAAVVVGWIVLNNSAEEPDPDGTATVEAGNDPPPDALLGYVPPVQDLKGKAVGDEVVFTWKAPEDLVEGDQYGYRVVSLTETNQPEPVETGTSVTVPRAEGEPTCVEVFVDRAGKQSTKIPRVCVPAG